MESLLTVTALGAVVGIDVSGVPEAWADEAARAWRSARVSDRPETTVAMTGSTLESALSDLSTRVTLAAIHARRGRLWMLHAAGLAAADGRVVALVGPSGRGKTTAARALGRRWAYVSDETVGVDPRSGEVFAYRKPLSIIVDPDRPKAQMPPSELGLRNDPPSSLRLSAIVVLDRDAEHIGDPRIETGVDAHAIADLVAQSSYLADVEAPLRMIVAAANALGGIRTVRYATTDQLERAVAQVLDAAVDAAWPAAVAPHPVVATEPSAGTGTRFSRGDVIDSVELLDGEEIAILHTGVEGRPALRVLGGVGPALWRAAAGVAMAELTRAVLAHHGPPPTGRSPDVREQVETLTRDGVLVESTAF